MILPSKENFIDDYMQAAMENGHESRSLDQIMSDAEVDWESTAADAAYEQGVHEGLVP